MEASTARLLCRLFGHKPGYKRTTGLYDAYYKAKSGGKAKIVEVCIRCGEEKKNWKK